MTDLTPWKYFLSLEKDFMKTLQYVELDAKHFDVFSVEYAKLLLLIGSEFETMAKAILNQVKSNYQVKKYYIYSIWFVGAIP